MYKLENTYWYFLERRKIFQVIIQKYLHSKNNILLDIGCGTGEIMEILSEFGEVYGIDSSKIALDFCRQRGLTNLYLIHENESYPFPDGFFDAICVFDVFEHLSHEENILFEIERIARAGAYVFINVPAFKFLWSTHDVALGHFRRYQPRSLVNLLRKIHKLRIIRLTFFNFFLFPVAVIYRLLRRIQLKK